MNEIVNILKNNNKTISTMESCTGGYIVNEITNIPGSSEILKFSAVTYSNEYKIKMGVSKEIIDKYTVYSKEVSKEMAKTISDFTNSNYGIGITGKLGKKDINNLSGNDNQVFVTIYNKDNDTYNTFDIFVEGNRKQCKKQVLDLIINKLLEELNGHI